MQQQETVSRSKSMFAKQPEPRNEKLTAIVNAQVEMQALIDRLTKLAQVTSRNVDELVNEVVSLPEPFCTVNEVAKFINKHPSYVRQLYYNGFLPAPMDTRGSGRNKVFNTAEIRPLLTELGLK